ncbi:hypothetical protein [Nocardia salmonicida]|uniref:hypothetical protein n=1 Tax=Nocardia salmonicida TaxID=53431 RepID=UPI0007A3CAD7|nr:hypothetical protein [Nocardia salmonicida]
MQVDEVRQIAEEAAKPSAVDLTKATGLIIDALAAETRALTVDDVVERVCGATDVTIVDLRQRRIDVSNPNATARDVQSAPVVRYAKAVHATRISLARLIAQGVVVPVVQSSGEPTDAIMQIGCKVPSMGTSIEISVGEVHIPRSFRLTPGASAIGNVPLLTVQQWVGDVEPLLNDRLKRVLGESLSAASGGAYLAAVILLGAVLEGAWYAVGEELRSHDQQLDQALNGDRTATVQIRVAELIRQLPQMKAVADDLKSFAGYVRVVRNYGIHTAAADDVAAESAFTEPGSYSLIQRAHSHLVQLLAAARKVDPAAFPT